MGEGGGGEQGNKIRWGKAKTLDGKLVRRLSFYSLHMIFLGRLFKRGESG